MSCKRSASSPGDREPSPIQTAGTGLRECLQVHGPRLEALTLPGCTGHRRAGAKLAVIYVLLFQHHLQEGTALWTGAIAHTAETGSHGLSVPPTGLEGFRVAGAHLSWKVPISDTIYQSCTPHLNADLRETNGSSGLAVMLLSAGLLMAG